MSEFVTKVKCGDKTYNISASGSVVYFSSGSKTGGTILRGVKIYNNELRLKDTNKPPSDFNLCSQIKESLKSGSCFITTAICQALDKADDCSELNTLRRFRDDIMLAHPYWQDLVSNYYHIAPSLAEKLSAHHQSHDLSVRLYQEYLVTILLAIEQERYQQAVTHYQAMVDYCQDLFSKHSNCSD